MDTLSPVPRIAYKDFIQYGQDSADMIIKFQDGDGDIGLSTSNTSSQSNLNNQYYYDFVALYFYKDNSGNFHRYLHPLQTDTLILGHHIPYLALPNKKKILQGEIKIHVMAPYWTSDPVTGKNVSIIRFGIYIYDRALNKSNIVYTPDIKISANW